MILKPCTDLRTQSNSTFFQLRSDIRILGVPRARPSTSTSPSDDKEKKIKTLSSRTKSTEIKKVRKRGFLYNVVNATLRPWVFYLLNGRSSSPQPRLISLTVCAAGGGGALTVFSLMNLRRSKYPDVTELFASLDAAYHRQSDTLRYDELRHTSAAYQIRRARLLVFRSSGMELSTR